MNVRCSKDFAVWFGRQRQSAAVVFLVTEKTGSQVFMLSSTPLMRPYIVKMTWSRPKMPCQLRIFFYLVPSESATKFHISVIQWARKCYIAQKRYIMTLFQKFFNTYNGHNNLIFYVLKFSY
jgi:hypothetical protein